LLRALASELAMAAPGIYSKATLNDNWLEDRLQPEGALSATGGFTKRTPRPVEHDLAYVGERYDVLSRISRMPPRTSFATPDDGFREQDTIHRTDFSDPKLHPTIARKKLTAPPLIHSGNAAMLAAQTTPRLTPRLKETGFAFGLNSARYWSTAHGEFYGESASRRPTPRMDPSTKGSAGVTTAQMEVRIEGLQCSTLCGEEYHETGDPGIDTLTQRSWLPGGDPALTHISHGGQRRDIPAQDNELSLPVGNGAMSKIRADLQERKGRLYRTATAITKAPHQKAGVRIFQDD